MSICPQVKGVMLAWELAERSGTVGREWNLDVLAGRLVEVDGDGVSAGLSVCASVIREAQGRGELAVWIGMRGATFFPPDFAAAGIDLEALPVVHVGDTAQALRAADTLLRSGGFAVVVLDLGGNARLPLAIQTRLVGLAKKHNTALMVNAGRSSRDLPIASLASLRVRASHARVGHDRFVCELRIEKDKCQAPGWRHREIRRGPDGLC